MPAVIQCETAITVCPEPGKDPAGIKRDGRQWQECCPVCFKKLRDLSRLIIMHTFPVSIKFVKKPGVVFGKIIKLWYRYKEVSADISDFVLNTPFFVAFSRIHEQSFEPVMLLEPGKTVGEITASALDDLGYHC